MDAVEKDDLDLDAGRHLDDWLILFCAFNEVAADRVGGFASTLAEAAGKNVGWRERFALAVAAHLSGEDAVGVGGKSASEAADNPGEQRLADKAPFTADNAAAHPGLAGKGDEPLDLADRETPAGLRAGHAHQLDVDLLGREIAARCAVDEAAGDVGGEQLVAAHDRAGRAGDPEDHGQRIALAGNARRCVDPDNDRCRRIAVGRQIFAARFEQQCRRCLCPSRLAVLACIGTETHQAELSARSV